VPALEKLRTLVPEKLDGVITVGMLLVSHIERALRRGWAPDRQGMDVRDSIERYVRSGFARRMRLTDLARHLCLSPSHTSALVKKHFGEPFNDLLARVRLGHAQQLLAHTGYSIERIAEMVGMNDGPYFHRRFKRATGMTPRRYRQAIRGGAAGSIEA
jgi:two-component system response regulator YesN